MNKYPDKDGILARIIIDPVTGCWMWNRSKDTKGYGNMIIGNASTGGKSHRAHRLAYEIWKGEIPEGLDLDHLCRVRACVNPEHLEPVTRRENLKRGSTFVADNLNRTHCPKGHPYSGDNLYIAKGGGRICKKCNRAWCAKSYKKRMSIPEKAHKVIMRRRELERKFMASMTAEQRSEWTKRKLSRRSTESKERAKEASREYARRHKEKRAAYMKEWLARDDNKKKQSEYMREYYQKKKGATSQPL